MLEYLLGMYCASDDEATIQNGMTMVKRIPGRELWRPPKIKSKIREAAAAVRQGDREANEKRDVTRACSNLG